MTALASATSSTAAPSAPSAPSAPVNGWVTRVRFSDVDLARVVHHGRYWAWCEEARFHFAEHVMGISPGDISALGVYMPVISCQCAYASPARWGDELVVVVQLEVLRSAVLTFRHVISTLRSPFRHIASATTKHVFTDHDLKLRLTIPSPFRARYDAAVRAWPDSFVHPPEVTRAHA